MSSVASLIISTEPFIASEVGTTFEGSFENAIELVKATKDAGANAAKFIFWFPDEIMADREAIFSYNVPFYGPQTQNMYDMLEKLTLSLDAWKEVKACADEIGVEFFATVNSPSGIEWAEELGLRCYKLSSWDFNYKWLWEEVGKTRKPVIIDTGPVNTEELERSLEWLGHSRYMLVHNSHAAVFDEMNMMSIPYMKERFNCLVGYSSQGQDSDADLMAVALGAEFLEKRLTVAKDIEGHHQHLALRPHQFAEYVRQMRNAAKMMGQKDIIPSTVDLAGRKKWFRMWVASRDITVGERLSKSNLKEVRIHDCLDYYETDRDDVADMRASRLITAGEPITSANAWGPGREER